MKAYLKLFLCALACSALVACGGKDDDDKHATQAERAGIGAVAHSAGATPFVAQLSYALRNFDHVASIQYRIAPRPGAHSQAADVSYDHAWLERRAAWTAAAGNIAFPVFGLYANHRNELTVTTVFRDGSKHVAQVAVPTGAYSGPAAVYAAPDIRRARGAASPGFDYMLIRNGLSAPVVVDTDGQLRWVGVGLADSISSLFGGDAFYIGDASNPLLHRMDVDGTFRSSILSDNRLSNFHHELAPGKTGFLGQFDVRENNILRLESTLAEIDSAGRVIKQWDLSQIFRDTMRAGGDDPANFVRDGIDWFHSNSAIYDRVDNALLVSSRENFVVKLDYDTGAIRWILGDPAKHWYVNYPSLRALALRVTEGKVPVGQHTLSVLANRELLLFNNGLASLNQPAGAPRGLNRTFSTPSRYAIDETTRTAREVWTWEGERRLYSDICSSTYEAAPNQYLVAYSVLAERTQARLIAVDAAGAVAFDFAYPSTVCDTVFIAQPFGLNGLKLR